MSKGKKDAKDTFKNDLRCCEDEDNWGKSLNGIQIIITLSRKMPKYFQYLKGPYKKDGTDFLVRPVATGQGVTVLN